jgi:hypothetical protein
VTAGDADPVRPAVLFETPDDLDAINRLYRERRWSDGLPIVPPTRERVQAMVDGAGRPGDALVARLAPTFAPATVQGIAINAVMAGCDASVMPVLLAVVEAVAAPEFNLQAVQATTNPVAVWIIVNGPLAARLEFNSGFNCLGEGHWTNATLGRALRLVLRNIGGALPGEMDRACQGQPGRYAFCCAENEAANPWEPLHVERGFRPEQSTVTVVGAEGTLNMNTHTEIGSELLRSFAGAMVHPPSNEYVFGGEPWLVLGPEHAATLAASGMTKAEVKARLWELGRMPASVLPAKDLERARIARTPELGVVDASVLLPIAPRPQDIQLIVAGGPGTHSTYVPSFGLMRAVTRAIATP